MTRAQSKPVGFVYKWTNLLNGKMYIGSHIGKQDDGYIGSGTLFVKAVNKYGIENFSREILFEGQADQVRKQEELLIRKYKADTDKMFYNLKNAAVGGWEYVNWSDQTTNFRKKKSKTMSDLYSDPARHPRGFKNKTHSEESRNKISESVLQLKLGRPVLKYDLEWNFIEEYDSINLAATSVNGSRSNIKYTIEGKFKHAYGFKWKYKID